jgi:hypothetical protein
MAELQYLHPFVFVCVPPLSKVKKQNRVLMLKMLQCVKAGERDR